jgi:hypothetical protein
MEELPSDLIPLPTMPWDKRPSDMPLDTEECRTALWLCHGNVAQAADMLKVHSNRLRAFIKNSEYLRREQDESREVLKDIAETNVYEALTDKEDKGRRDSMSRFVLASVGRDRGYGNATAVDVKGLKGRVTISWADDDAPAANDDNNTIDVTPNKSAAE